jgi:hypothetical protein
MRSPISVVAVQTVSRCTRMATEEHLRVAADRPGLPENFYLIEQTATFNWER